MARAYQGYWERLKDAPMSEKYKAKVLNLMVPESRVRTTKRMISKEKDNDWQFRNDNALNPWSITFRIVGTTPGRMPGHGMTHLKILMDRKTDL